MSRVKKDIQLNVTTSKETWSGARVFGVLARAGINIKSFCAYGTGTEASFVLLTADPANAEKVLLDAGYKVHKDEVVTMQVSDRSGRAHDLSDKLAKEGINIEFCYATATDTPGQETMAVFKTSNNDKALDILSKSE